jgi:hypothetical protein
MEGVDQMNRTGLLVTFFTFLFLASLIGMSFTIKEHQTYIESTRKYGLSISRTGERFDQVEDAMLSLMENVGRVSFDRDFNFARFSFSLPRTQAQSLYESRLADLNRFVKKYPDSFDFNLNGGLVDLTTFSLWKNDVNFTQKLGASRDENAAFIVPHLPDFNYFLVEIRLTGQDFNHLSYSVTDCSNCSAPIGLRVIVKDENGSIVETYDHGNLDAFNHSEVLIETSAPGSTDLNVAILPVGRLSMRNDSNSTCDFNALIDFGGDNDELPVPHFPHGLIEVSDKVLGARKK